MAQSTISFVDIDEEFPIAGQDNDSQGFRDNFRLTKQALERAKLELSDLLTNVARTDQANDFLGQQISNASVKKISEFSATASNIEGSVGVVYWHDSHMQYVNVTDDLLLTLDGWGSNGQMCKMRIGLRSVSEDSHSVTLSAAGTGIIKVSSRWPKQQDPITQAISYVPYLTIDSQTDPFFIDVWTTNAGSTVFVDYLGKFEDIV